MKYIVQHFFGSGRLFMFSLSAAKVCLLAFVTVTSFECCEFRLQLRRERLKFWRKSASFVMHVGVLILTAFGRVQLLNRLFATFPLVRLSDCVIVVSWILTLLSLSRWQSLPSWKNVTSGVSKSGSLEFFWSIGNEVKAVQCSSLNTSASNNFSILGKELRAWVSVSLRNRLVVNVSRLSVEDKSIRPLQTAVHLCVSPLLPLTGWNFIGVFQNCIVSSSASKSQSKAECFASFPGLSG